jgi:rhamnogalacturonan endolyase
LGDELADAPKTVVFNFDDQQGIDAVKYGGYTAEATLNTDPKFIKSGKGSLRLFAENWEKDVKPEDRVSFHPQGKISFRIAPNPDIPIDLNDYKGMGVWLYVPYESSLHFFGRTDVQIHINGAFTATTHHWRSISMRAISVGWNYYYFEFCDIENIDSLPEDLTSFGMTIGTFNDGWDKLAVYLDEIAFYPSEPLLSLDALEEIILNSPDKTKRYKALKELEGFSSLRVLEIAMAALEYEITFAVEDAPMTRLQGVARDSKLSRKLAAKIAGDVAIKLGAKSAEVFEKAYKSPNWETREYALRAVMAQPKLSDLAIKLCRQALFDDVYYVRDQAYKYLLENGVTREQIAAEMVQDLTKARNTEDRIKYFTMLYHIGPLVADIAMPQTLEILRNPEMSFTDRAWALRTAWWLREEQLTAEDWAVGLPLAPGEVQRTLLDRVVDRLEQKGAASIPVLLKELRSSNPTIRARVASILGNIGIDNSQVRKALEGAVKDRKWYVGWEADNALRKIRPDYNPPTSPSPKQSRRFKDVTARNSGSQTIVSNGLVEMVFERNERLFGPVIVRKPGGPNLVDDEILKRVCAFRYSKSPSGAESQWFSKNWGFPIPDKFEAKVFSSDKDHVDFVISYSDETNPLIWDHHYVIRKGVSGVYSYTIIRNVSGEDYSADSWFRQSAIGLGNYAPILALTWKHYDYAVLHDRLRGPAASAPTADTWSYIYRERGEYSMGDAFRLQNGQFWSKHSRVLYELETPVMGCSGRNGGFWQIMASHDFYQGSGAGWTRQALWDSLFINNYGATYQIIGSLTSPVTEDFEKIYGPTLYYVNDGENAEEQWVDAKRQANDEIAQWPHKWVKQDLYHDRGSLKGRLTIAGGHDPEGAIIALANPIELPEEQRVAGEGQTNIWMRNINRYSYHTTVEADGSFEIPAVHQDTYDLFVYKPGLIGTLRKDEIKIAKGQTVDVGTLSFSPYEPKKILWQIGVPDGMAMEFKNGRNYHMWDNFERYGWDFPNGVNYVIGKSDWKTDWNYCHISVDRVTMKRSIWTVEFELDEVPAGKVVLMTCVAGRGNVDAIINGKKAGEINVQHIGSHWRSAPVSEMVQREIVIDKSLLKKGTNRLELTFIKDLLTNPAAVDKVMPNWIHSPHIVYDYLRLETRD